MRANFARHGRRLLVCRSRLLSCSLLTVSSSPRRTLQPAPSACLQFERTIFQFLFEKPPREVRQPVYEPGWKKIMEWRSRMLDSLRPHSRSELIAAWQDLMNAKVKSRLPLNSTQALHCWHLLLYLSQKNQNKLLEDEKFVPLTVQQLSMARKVLLELEPVDITNSHLDFARALYKYSADSNSVLKPGAMEKLWSWFVRVLSRYGSSIEARDMLYNRWDTPGYNALLVKDDQLLEVVAEGFAKEGKEAELLELIEHAKNKGIPLDGHLHLVIVRYFASRDRIQETQAWFAKPVSWPKCRSKTYRAIASFARRNNLQEWAAPIFKTLGESSPGRPYWDVVLQSMLLMGRNLSEVATLMEHMIDRNKEIKPTIYTINGLLGVAVELQDYQLAQDILQLGDDKGIEMNGESYLRMLQLCAPAQDLERAQHAFEKVRDTEPWATESRVDMQSQLGDLKLQFASVVNEYILILLQQTPPRLPLVLSILDAVEELSLRLRPATLGALSLRFLENDQPLDVLDMLSVNSFLFSETEREVVQAVLTQYCLDPKTSTSRAWSSYRLLQQYFEDMNLERRTQLMHAFFARKRPDMASLVFGNMRQHRNKAMNPHIDTYIACFEGFGRYPDDKGLEIVYNMFKMDTTMQAAANSTRLQTALMLAMTACDKLAAALDLWQRITRSSEGPTYATLEVVFWTLEKKPGGERMAREIWDRIERMDLEVSPRVYNAYIGAVAGSGSEKEVRGLIMKMDSVTGIEPEPMTLAIAHNALPGLELQKSFIVWAKQRYRQQWDEVEKFGRRMNSYALWQYKIDRNMRADV